MGWTIEDQKQAWQNGWLLADSPEGDGSEIQRLDDSSSLVEYAGVEAEYAGVVHPLFNSDYEATGHVCRAAKFAYGDYRHLCRKAIKEVLGDVIGQLPNGVRKVLDLSTAHAPSPNPPFGAVRGEQHQTGWVLFVGGDVASEDDLHRLADWLRPIYRMALQEDAILINFDRDAEIVDSLPTYEWE